MKKPTQDEVEEKRLAQDVPSRRFTPDAKGTAMQQPPPQGAGHSYNPKDPYEYAKIKGQHK